MPLSTFNFKRALPMGSEDQRRGSREVESLREVALAHNVTHAILQINFVIRDASFGPGTPTDSVLILSARLAPVVHTKVLRLIPDHPVVSSIPRLRSSRADCCVRTERRCRYSTKL